MPELPEVQTIVDDLKKKILNRRLAGFWSDTPRIFPKNKISNLKSQIRGYKITSIHRRGKNIIFYLKKLGKEKILLIHPKLTGRLILGKKILGGKFFYPVKNYIRAVFKLNNGIELGFSDVRKFGKIIFGDKEKIESLSDLKDLGPDPLSKAFTLNEFIRLVGAQKRKIKLVLLDQEVTAGIGNIYSDEVLWYAKIHPFTPANKIPAKKLQLLYNAIRETLKKSIKLRGSTIRDYRDTSGREGGYIKIRRVYAREGLPCFRCGAKIKRVKINVRSAHFCPRCQKID